MLTLKPGVVADVPVSKLERDPNQPRRTFPEEGLKALAESLAHRVEVPLKVRPLIAGTAAQDKFVIVDGERRWRAAKIAKLETLPCLLDETGDELQIGATQLTTSAHREDLAPLDIAEFLTDLQKRHKLPTNDLAAAMAKRGIPAIGPATIERYLKLVSLPAWAKELMRAGKLTEPQAQLLMPALGFEKVLEDCKRGIKNEIQWKGAVTQKEVEETVRRSFSSVGIDLHGTYGERVRAFPIGPCRKCEHYIKVGGRELCMNQKEFDRKNVEALAVKAEQSDGQDQTPASRETDPTKVKPRKLTETKGIVVLDKHDSRTYESLDRAPFNKSPCRKCPHKRDASHDGGKAGAEPHCFHVPCFENLKRQASRQKSRTEHMREYLERWLRPIVAREIVERASDKQLDAILLWLATGAVTEFRQYGERQLHEKAARLAGRFLKAHDLKDLPSLFEFGVKKLSKAHRKELARLAALVLTRDQLRWMAQQIKIDMTAAATLYVIDAAYLNLKRKSELHTLAKVAGMEEIGGLGVADLKKELLKADHAKKIGLPEDLADLYEEDQPKPEREYGGRWVEDLMIDLTDDERAALEACGEVFGKRARRAS